MADEIKLTEKSAEVFNYVKANDHCTVPQMAEALNRTARSVNANITDLGKKGLVLRVKEAVEGEDDEVTFIVLTEDGMAFEG